MGIYSVITTVVGNVTGTVTATVIVIVTAIATMRTDGDLLTACCTPDAGLRVSVMTVRETHPGHLANWKVTGDPG